MKHGKGIPPSMNEIVETIIGEELAGFRLDAALAEAVEDASRSFMKRLIKEGRVAINGQTCVKPSRVVAAEDRIRVEIPEPPPALPEPEDLPINILHEDAEIVVVNKASGMVVHPAPGHYTGTLVNAILHHCPDFQRPGVELARPGVVHRLDRDTSGVMVVAKTQRAFNHLARQAAEHTFDRRYLALVRGEFGEQRGRICASIGRSLADPSRMAVTGVAARDAVTNFEVLERFGPASLVALRLETGRTHQIRVHMRFAGRPVLGDPVYGVTDFDHWPISPETRAILEALPGQALHAELLGLTHPASGERISFTAPPPAEFMHALDALRALK